jgi:peptide-methionine (S)-S-oxide reductase
MPGRRGAFPGRLEVAAPVVVRSSACSSAAGVRDLLGMERDSPNRETAKKGVEKATFAAGCFWGIEAAFRKVPGVISAAVGYAGGTLEDPTYENVCTGRTGHAESVQVEYDPAKVSYEDLLSVFWEIHDPTTLNRQGPDVGTQYRSVIFFHTPQQEAAARASKEKLQRTQAHSGSIVTEIVPASAFYRAEEYHQRYFERRGRH